MKSKPLGLVALAVFALLLAAAGERSAPTPAAAAAHSDAVEIAPREACADRMPLRQALFGDLHVHTGYSMDAFLFDTRTVPDDAYRFARGERIKIAPLDEYGLPAYPVQLARPLDFAAVTDHAESFGSTRLCTDAGSSVYDTASCRIYRGELGDAGIATGAQQAASVIRRMTASATDEVCGEDGRICRDGGRSVWAEMQTAAETHYDRSSACAFTTFVAYEYGLTPRMSKIHRNVIFRNEHVIAEPIHAQMETSPLHLLRRLRRECNENQPGCEALAIPHNSNLSDDWMFALDYDGARTPGEERRIARLRSSMEPLVEIMQIKGDSECRNGLWGVGGAVDELCGFEKWRNAMGRAPTPPDCKGTPSFGALAGQGCVGRDSFVRSGLIKGLAERKRIGENPLRFGFIGSTDDHKGTMGDVDEWAAVERPFDTRTNNNPGGLMGVWSEENSRDAIFDAMQRRETFATSGPRIEPRFFGGWSAALGAKLCAGSDLVERGYASGVAMGGILPQRPASATAPRFVVSALRDAGSEGHPGGLLQRVQIIKGWVGADDLYMQRVYEVAGSPKNGADVDPATCEPRGKGHASLCAAWQDPDFDPDANAVYYARIIENPSCRWSTLACNAMTAAGERHAACDDPRIPKTVQERAWTSPIWYEAPGAS